VDVARIVEAFGFHHYQKGEYDEALRWYRRALGIREKIFGAGHVATGWNLYDQACILALAGDPSAALTTLRRALDCGWASGRIFEDDDLDSLHDDPEFAAILEEVRGRIDASGVGGRAEGTV